MAQPWRYWTYQRVGTKDDGSEASDNEKGEKKMVLHKSTITSIAATLSFAVLFFVGSGILQWRANAISSARSPSGRATCGNSTQEALSLGCSFDQLMWAWFPNYCPHYANDKYLDAAAWNWYTDPYNKTLVERHEWESVLDNDLTVYGEVREHTAHCVYMLFNLAQVVRDDGRKVQKQVDYEHLEHCADLLMELVMRDQEKMRIGTEAGRILYDQDC